MPITFDTLEDLKSFYRSFKMVDLPAENGSSLTNGSYQEEEADIFEEPKPARRAKKVALKQPSEKKLPKEKAPKKQHAKAVSVAAPTKAKVAEMAPSTRSRKKLDALPEKTESAKRSRGPITLTAQIQGVIQEFISKKKDFTANDVYDILSKSDKAINKQSVITSVLKQMNTRFQSIKVSEKPGAGPRAVKVYLP